MEYKQFIVKAFSRGPGKWRASVKRLDGKPLMHVGRARVKLDQFITGADSSTPKDALLLAMAAIDAGAFSRRPGCADRGTENDPSLRPVGSAPRLRGRK